MSNVNIRYKNKEKDGIRLWKRRLAYKKVLK